MTIHWKAVEQYFTVCFFNFTQFVNLKKLLILDLLALSGVNGWLNIMAASLTEIHVVPLITVPFNSEHSEGNFLPKINL